MNSHRKEFNEWVVKNNINVFDKLSDVTDKYNFELEKGQKCVFVNDYGVKFEGLTIMGFSERQNNVFTGEDTGRYVYLDYDCYWFPSKPESIILNKSTELREDISMNTDYGLNFRAVSEINPSWSTYDQTIAKTHLAQWGVIAIDKHGLPIDNEYDYEAIDTLLQKKTHNVFTDTEKITDIKIFSLKEGGMGISCKVNGVKQSYKKLTKEDLNALNNQTNRFNLAQKYLSLSSDNTSGTMIPKDIYSSGSKTLLGDISTSPGIEPQVSNYRIHDKSTGKTEILDVSDIDLSKQSSESIKGLLSGKQVEITNKSGAVQMMGLNKTVTGWSLKIGKQAFSATDQSMEI